MLYVTFVYPIWAIGSEGEETRFRHGIDEPRHRPRSSQVTNKVIMRVRHMPIGLTRADRKHPTKIRVLIGRSALANS